MSRKNALHNFPQLCGREGRELKYATVFSEGQEAKNMPKIPLQEKIQGDFEGRQKYF